MVQAHGSSQYEVVQKQKYVMQHLRNWSSLTTRSVEGQIVDLRKMLQCIQQNLRVEGDIQSDWEPRNKLDDLLQKQELYWA